MKLKKIFITSTNMSGKGYMTALLDGSTELCVFPYHKFGISFAYDEFLKYIKNKEFKFDNGYFNYDAKNTVCILFGNGDKSRISIGEILNFIFTRNEGIRYLFQTHMTKMVAYYSGDKLRSLHSLDFDITTLIKYFSKNLLDISPSNISIEDIDDCLYIAYMQSVGIDPINGNCKTIVLFGSNDSSQTTCLFNFYQNFQIIFIKRDLLSLAFSIVKRTLSQKSTKEIDYDKVFLVMLLNASKIKKKYNEALLSIEEFQDNRDKVKVVIFEKLFCSVTDEMNSIAIFLNIKVVNEILYKPSLFGQSLPMESESIQDDPYSCFSNAKIKRLNHFYYGLKGESSVNFILRYYFDKAIIKIINTTKIINILRVFKKK
jgi:hypothetical protein